MPATTTQGVPYHTDDDLPKQYPATSALLAEAVGRRAWRGARRGYWLRNTAPPADNSWFDPVLQFTEGDNDVIGINGNSLVFKEPGVYGVLGLAQWILSGDSVKAQWAATFQITAADTEVWPRARRIAYSGYDRLSGRWEGPTTTVGDTDVYIPQPVAATSVAVRATAFLLIRY